MTKRLFNQEINLQQYITLVAHFQLPYALSHLDHVLIFHALYQLLLTLVKYKPTFDYEDT